MSKEQFATLDEGEWDKNDPRRIFCEGARWYLWWSDKATMFGAERRAAEAEAEKRYPVSETPLNVFERILKLAEEYDPAPEGPLLHPNEAIVDFLHEPEVQKLLTVPSAIGENCPRCGYPEDLPERDKDNNT